MGPDAMIIVLWSFKPTFSLSSFTFIKRLFGSFSLSAIRVGSSEYLNDCGQSLLSLLSTAGASTGVCRTAPRGCHQGAPPATPGPAKGREGDRIRIPTARARSAPASPLPDPAAT